MESTTMNRPKMLEKVCYGFGDLGSCLFWQTITIYLSYFYTDVFGLTPAVAGTMFLVSRVVDALFDVIIGMTADRTETRWGKFRPYIIFGAIPLAIAAVAAFSTPAFGGTGKIVYAYITFMLFMFLYSTVNIPYTSLLGVISGDPEDRTQASSWKFVGAYLGGIIVSATALIMAKHFGRNYADAVVGEQHGWQMTMIVYGIAAILFFVITFLSTKERIKPIVEEKTTIKDDLHDIVRNVPWILLFTITILFIFYNCVRLNVTTHYFKYFIGDQDVPWLAAIINFFGGETNSTFSWESLVSIFNTLGQLVSLVGVLLLPWFSKMLGRKRATIVLMVASFICTGSFFFFSPDDIFLILFFQFIGSITGGPISALLWVMYADTADYSEWKNGRRATGLVFSASIMSNKLGWAIGGMISMLILQATGFVANQAQNADTLFGMKAMMSVIPVAVGIFALGLLVFGYKLDEKTMDGIQAELEERRKLKEQA